jgi:hypothetical protein
MLRGDIAGVTCVTLYRTGAFKVLEPVLRSETVIDRQSLAIAREDGAGFIQRDYERFVAA